MRILKLSLLFLLLYISDNFHAKQLQELYASCFLGDTISPLLIYNATTFIFQEPFIVLGYQKREEFERRIVFLEDTNNKKFVLKCYGPEQKEEAICEYLGSFMGTSVAVPVNKVKIILGGSFLAEINNGTNLATLHTFVPGKELCKWYETPKYDIILKGGLISEKHLKCLSISNDLCDILALDIFLNNKDRHHENCFFDEMTGRYYAIDLGDIFLSVRKCANIECDISDTIYETISYIIAEEKIVAYDTYQFLNSLSLDSLSLDQKKALKRVAFTLENLMLLYTAESIFNMWIAIGQEISCIYTECKKTYLKLLLNRNMYWVYKVVERIRQLV